MNLRLIAEFIGTFALVFIGAGSAATAFGGLVGIALAHGLTLMVLVTALSPISGAHFNPAITLALWMRQQSSLKEALAYVATQLLASLAAAATLSWLLSSSSADFGATRLSDSLTLAQGFSLEALMTFFLSFSIFRSRGERTPLVAGMALAAAILMAGPLTGASLNPARSLGPCLMSGSSEQLWLYFVAPTLGAIAAAWSADWLKEQGC